jgi:hypothetical protein
MKAGPIAAEYRRTLGLAHVQAKAAQLLPRSRTSRIELSRRHPTHEACPATKIKLFNFTVPFRTDEPPSLREIPYDGFFAPITKTHFTQTPTFG